MKFNWEIIVGSIIGFCGAAFGSVGGVGGGGIFVPMLTLIIGFDAKSATAISKCKPPVSQFGFYHPVGMVTNTTFILKASMPQLMFLLL